MDIVRVGIAYEPRLYVDLIAQVFCGVHSVTLVEPPFSGADVLVVPLTASGKPDMDILPKPIPQGTKLVAVSPDLDRGLVRLPGESRWEEVRPFGLDEIFGEVVAGRERSASMTHTVTRPTRSAEQVARRRINRAAWPWRQMAPARQWAVVFAALVVLLSFSVSMIVISAQSLPGEPLYSVKRLTENVQLAFAPQTSKPDLHAMRAQRRLEEIVALARKGIVLPEIVRDLESELQAALDTAQSLPLPEQQALLTRLVDVTRDHEGLLMEIARRPDRAALAQDLENVVKALAGRREQALQALAVIRAVLPTPTATPTQPAQRAPTGTAPVRTPTLRLDSPTPVPPGGTPTPLPPDENQVPAPNGSPVPSETREPTSTGTQAPAPTQTPQPTSTGTQIPLPTQTPEPTSAPTQTPEPTPVPTQTPEPTPAATQTRKPPGPTHTPQPPGQTPRPFRRGLGWEYLRARAT